MHDLREETLETALEFKSRLLTRATSMDFPGGNRVYAALRERVVCFPGVKPFLPECVRTCYSAEDFWGYISGPYKSYHERREHLREAFAPLLAFLESAHNSPGVASIGAALEAFDRDFVHRQWQQALDRRDPDPEGAITLARTLLETVCKHVLDDAGVAYQKTDDMNDLWKAAAGHLNLMPDQHDAAPFKRILGSCQNIVGTIASLRNEMSDSHGRGRQRVKPGRRHAELTVNLAGAMAAFVVETARERKV
jgi:hypothetical protein